MKHKNKLVFINALIIVIYILVYVSLAIYCIVSMKTEITKAWFGASIILALLALVFILTMKNKEFSQTSLKLLNYTIIAIFILRYYHLLFI